MTFEELEKEIEKIEKEATEKKKIKIVEYCKSNNPYKIGDIISGQSSIIKIEGIKFSSGYLRFKPECVYHGARLRKDLTPYKSNEKDTIFQNNVKKQIK